MNLEKQTDQQATKNWYYLDAHNATQGPFQEFALRNFLAEQIIQPTTYVWTEGMPEWKKYHDVFDVVNIPASPSNPFNSAPSPNSVQFTESAPNQVVFGQQPNNSIGTQYHAAEVTIPYILFSFSGRLRRKHYWLTSIVVSICLVSLAFLIIEINDTLFIASLFIAMIPLIWINIAMGMKRLHDINMSGWFLLLNFLPYLGGLILFILFLLPSTQGDNKYGPQP